MADGAVRYAMLLAARGGAAEAERMIDRVLGAIGDREAGLMLEAELYALAISSHGAGARQRLNRITAGLNGRTPAERLLLGLHANDAVNAGAMNAADAARLVGDALGDGWLLQELGPDSPTYLLMAGAGEWLDVLDLAERELSAALVEARRRGAAFGVAVTSSILGAVAWKRGQLARAEAEAWTGVDVARQMGWIAGYPIPIVYLTDILADRGDFSKASQLPEEHHLDGPLPDTMSATMLLGSRGRLRLAQGKSAAGIADLQEQAARIERVGDSPPYLLALLAKSLVPALMSAGHPDDALRIASPTLRLAQAFGQPRSIADASRASALAHTGGPDIEQLSAAATIYERIGARLELARTLLDIGSTLRRRRQPAQARSPLRQALDLARACDSHPLAERAEHELRAAGARPRRDRITGKDALTATEQRIAQLANDGLTNRQIAETLFVTRKTVSSHLEHIFRKLDIHARRELNQALSAEDESHPTD